MADFREWWRKNWTTTVILLIVFFLAVYLRTVFTWGMAAPNGLLSGGSDSFYYHRIIIYNVVTGHQLVYDCGLNYPICLTNPRPPLFSWTIAVAGRAFALLFGDVFTSVKYAELLSTALWGSVTIFPLYFLTKEAFGKRAALLAAFLLAILPADLQRSPATNGDHDSMILFFAVSGFYFFLRSLKTLDERRWVENWAFWRKEGRASIRKGIADSFRGNKKSTLYALLSGWCITTIAMIWQGWAYAPIILLVYFLFQILVHRFRNQDPMGIVAMFIIAVGLPLLVAFPWYYQNNQIATWFDVPAYLYLVAVALGVVFTVTRDYPWALVVPLVVGIGGSTLAVLAAVHPGVASAFVSGAGYFVRTKAYETIAEAQPPGISQVILSFGVATYFLSLFGLIWMARGFPKRPTPDYLFTVVWAVAAIFMANSAARFIFNASPAFAMTSAWVIVLFLEWLRFDDMPKTFRSLSGSRLTAFRRSVKPRHVIGTLVVLFIVLLPNAWYGVDAAIPYEAKSTYDQQVYNAFPSFLKPAGYSSQTQGGGTFFLGAFGYSLPLESQYYPAAWNWFQGQDANTLPLENRPAYLSWWDYGFESIDRGQHPTVADNFLDGYQLAGQFITAQSEQEALALLDLRLLEGDFWANHRNFSSTTKGLLDGLNVAWPKIEDAFRNPKNYVSVVQNDPFTYGHWQDVQELNAQYIYGRRVLMDALDTDQLASLNNALRTITGASIRYFAADTRLFPLSGSNTGIFYAPAKLSDHRILDLPDGRSIPYDFFDIMATTSNRGTINLKDVKATDTVSALSLAYKSMFYDSMFYRAYVGYKPSDVGQNCSDCVPGIQSPTNQQIANYQPMPAWDLSHFKMVYRTAYYNPYPAKDVQNHTDAWQAMDYNEATVLQGKINSGEAVGVVDTSASTAVQRGVVFVKYYDGAYLNGTVRLNGIPWPGVRVTVSDEYGIPHDTNITDSKGRYSVLLPFGDINVQLTTGALNNRTMLGTTSIESFKVSVSDAAAMRQNVDSDGDGVPDWRMTRDVEVQGERLDGTLFLDTNRDGKLTAGEPVLSGADVTLHREDVRISRTAKTAPDGHVLLDGLWPGTYNATLTWQSRTFNVTNITIAKNQPAKDLAVGASTLQGFVADEAGHHIADADVVATDALNGTAFRARAASDGFFAFTGLLPGNFDMKASQGTSRSLPDRVTIPEGTATLQHNVTVYEAASVQLQTSLGGAPKGFVTVEFVERSVTPLSLVVTTDATGRATFSLPAGVWDVHARHYTGSDLWAFLGSLTLRNGDSVAYRADLGPGATVTGQMYEADQTNATLGSADIVFRGPGGQLTVRADAQGNFFLQVPAGTYTYQVSYLAYSYLATQAISGTMHLKVPAVRGTIVGGTIVRAFPQNQTVQIENPITDATVAFSDATRTYEILTGTDGKFQLALPSDGRFALHVSRLGYHDATEASQTPNDWTQSIRVALTAENVTVSGLLRQGGTIVTDASVPVVLQALGPGAVTASATLDGMGRYTAAVSPGRYSVQVDRGLSGNGSVRQQLAQDTPLTVNVGDVSIPLDLDLVTRMRVDGTLTLSGAPTTAVVRFDGPEVRTANATDGSFSTYVAAGMYTVSANLTSGQDTYLAIQSLAVTAPATANLALLRATNVTGTVRFQTAAVQGVPVTLTGAGGATVTATSDSFGAYHVFALGGTYAVSVDHVATITDAGMTRTVRYTFSGGVTVTQDSRYAVFDVDVSRALENTTVAGTVLARGAPAAARITFLQTGTSGMNATASAGGDGRYSIGLQPGTYDVYAFAPLERAVFLGPVVVPTGAAPAVNLTLGDSLEVLGATTVGGARVAANLTFTGPTARVAFQTTTAGYDVFLPAATYSVAASAPSTERGVSVAYSATTSLALTESTVLNLQLTKVVHRGVDVTWDSAQRTTISAGGTADYTVVVKNTGNEDDTLILSASSADFTVSFSDDHVSVPFGTDNTRSVGVTVTAHADAIVDHGPLTVNVRSQADESVVKSVTLEVDVVRFRGLTAAVSATAPTWDGRYLNYTIEIKNTGNGAETYVATLPNLNDLQSAGWRATLVPSGGSPDTNVSVPVSGNKTATVTLSLQRVGGSAGATALVQVVNQNDAQYASLVRVSVQLPALAVDGSILAGGTDIASQQPGLDLPTIAFLVFLAALVIAVVYLVILRRRSR